MRVVCFLFILAMSMTLTHCVGSGPKVIEKPVSGLRNTSVLEFDKIVLTDTATILYTDAYFHPNQWIRIDSATYIQAGGKKYKITGADSIELNQEHWMPESGETHFTLYFPPVPKGTKTIDFIESDCETCFKIWDIDLTGKAKAYKADLPEKVLNAKVSKDYRLPEPVYKAAKTKVTLTLTGLREGYAPGEPELTVINSFTQDSEGIPGKSEADGKYTFEVSLFSTSAGYIYCRDIYIPMMLNPGEDAEVYYDVTASAKRKSRYNPQPELVCAGFTGGLSEVNIALEQYADSMAAYNFLLYAYIELADPAILDMNEQQYLDYIFKQYNEKTEKVEASDLPGLVKQLVKNNLKSGLVDNVSMKHAVYELNYRVKNKLGWGDPVDVVFPRATEKDFLALKSVGLADPMWIYSKDFGQVVSYMLRIKPESLDMKEVTGAESSLLQDLEKTSAIMKKGLLVQELTPEEEKILAEASTPYYKEVYTRLYEETKRNQEDAFAIGGFSIETTPDVANEKLLEAIVANYKGKVVFVDFWATWCGPCLNAMKTIKPIKPEMKDKGVVSIYISGETSPKNKWITMLPEIGGLHYYLTNEQWNALNKKYNIRGIPAYMIFDKNGKKIFETFGYPGNDKVIAELSKVW